MTPSTSLFKTGPSAARRSVDLQLAWLDAAADAHEAYLAWRDADRSAQADGFAVYRAALDREEAAARTLQSHARAAASTATTAARKHDER